MQWWTWLEHAWFLQASACDCVVCVPRLYRVFYVGFIFKSVNCKKKFNAHLCLLQWPRPHSKRQPFIASR
jgi:hypothetical protein